MSGRCKTRHSRELLSVRTTESTPSSILEGIKGKDTVAVNSPILNIRESRSSGGDRGRAVVLVVDVVAVVELLPDRRLP